MVLDQTAFYPRGGGQEPDHGTIEGKKVLDVEKYGASSSTSWKGTPSAEEGARCRGEVNSMRRQKIRRIHTATHLLNGASRQVLGPWVWQHSAFKEEDYGRLDITHFAKLTDEEVRKIEDAANDMVMRDYPVNVSYLPRREAEARYGFRLFQGGVVPSKTLRIVNIADWDVEACGGTHTDTTGPGRLHQGHEDGADPGRRGEAGLRRRLPGGGLRAADGLDRRPGVLAPRTAAREHHQGDLRDEAGAGARHAKGEGAGGEADRGLRPEARLLCDPRRRGRTSAGPSGRQRQCFMSPEWTRSARRTDC